MSAANAVVIWPSLDVDQRAWDLAKRVSTENESLTVTIDRANRIKAVLQGPTPHQPKPKPKPTS